MKLLRETENDLIFINYGRESNQDSSLTISLQCSKEEEQHLKKALKSLPEACGLDILGHNLSLTAKLLRYDPRFESYHVELSPKENRLSGASIGSRNDGDFYVHLEERKISCSVENKRFEIYAFPRSEKDQ